MSSSNIPSLTMQIDPQIFPLDIVLLASYYLVNRLDIRITGHPNERIEVLLTPKLKYKNKQFQSPSEILWAFNERLVRASLDEYNLEKNADIRHALLRTAFTFEMPEIDLLKPKAEVSLEDVTYVYTVSEPEKKIDLTVNPANNPLRCVLLSLFSVTDRVKEDCCFVIRRFNHGQVCCEISQPKKTNLTAIWKRIASELEKYDIRSTMALPSTGSPRQIRFREA